MHTREVLYRGIVWWYAMQEFVEVANRADVGFNAAACSGCGIKGDAQLFLCDGCPAAFHAGCVGRDARAMRKCSEVLCDICQLVRGAAALMFGAQPMHAPERMFCPLRLAHRRCIMCAHFPGIRTLRPSQMQATIRKHIDEHSV